LLSGDRDIISCGAPLFQSIDDLFKLPRAVMTDFDMVAFEGVFALGNIVPP